MVKHIVMFKLNEKLSQQEKNSITDKFKKAIEELPSTIKSIRKIYVSGNINPAEKWDICLESEFDSLEDVKAYSVHPNHIAAGSILKDSKIDRACVDFEV